MYFGKTSNLDVKTAAYREGGTSLEKQFYVIIFSMKKKSKNFLGSESS